MTHEEKLAYARGYNAGKKRLPVELRERFAVEREAFRKRVFLAALPAVIAAQQWEMDGKPVTTLDQRVELARRFADKAAQVF